MILSLRRARAVPALSSLCALAVLALSATAQQDQVLLKDGKTESGRVKSAEYEGLVIEAKGQSKTIEWPQVASITFKDPPEEYTLGREAFEASKFDDALTAFEKLKADSKLRAPIKQDAFYLAAASQLGKGAWDQAIAAFDALRKEFPKSRYLMEAGEGYVLAFGQKKDGPGALKALESMANDAAAQGVATGFGATISMLKGRLLEDQDKVTEAAASYALAEKTSGVSLAVQQQARLGQGRCLMKQKKPAEAEAIFRKLSTEDAPSSVLAGAWNGLGELWRQDAKNKAEAEQADKLLDAAFAYMRGVVQYGPGPGESQREYKRSLEGATNAFQNLAQVEKNAERKERYTALYKERKAQLDREFPPGR